MKKQSKITIDPDILILELTEMYPQATDFLIREYEFHCIGCIMAGFETLRQGAEAHGIIGKDFDELIRRLEKYLQTENRIKH
jgi:hybrid cluster-associated redox disulfide protein